MTLVYVALGAAAGAPLRYVLAHVLDARGHRRLPRGVPHPIHWGTILVNVAGSFLIGLFSGLVLTGCTLALLGTGFCGALTTYSAFAVQTHDLGPRLGTWNVLLTLPAALGACALGFSLGA